MILFYTVQMYNHLSNLRSGVYMKKVLLSLSLLVGFFNNVFAEPSSLTIKNTVPDIEVNISPDLLCNIASDEKFGPNSIHSRPRGLDENPIRYGEEKKAIWQRCTLVKKSFFEGVNQGVNDHSKIQISLKDLKSGDIYYKTIQMPDLAQEYNIHFANKDLLIRLSHEGNYFYDNGGFSNQPSVMVYSTNSNLEINSL